MDKDSKTRDEILLEIHLKSLVYAYRAIKRWQEYAPGEQKTFAERVRLEEILNYRLERACEYIEKQEELADG